MSTAEGAAGPGTLAATRALAMLAARRDRIMLAVWAYVFIALFASTAYSFRKLYPTAAGRIEFATSVGHNPALLSLYGPLFGNSVGSLAGWRTAAVGAVAAGLMSIFIVIRHTRADEETGRLELVGSAAVGRHAALAAGLGLACAANLLIAAAIAAVLIALRLPAAGSAALALAVAGSGLVFAGVAAITAQLAGTARLARGLAIGVLGVGYLLRAIGDSSSAGGPRWLSWLSPMGWAELIRSFAAIRWWVLALPVAVAVLLAAVAGLLAARRDYAAGLLPARPGPDRAPAWLGSPLALAWRLQRGTLIAWLAGALVYGVAFGSAAKGIGGLLGSSELRHIMDRLGGRKALVDAYLAAIMSFNGLIAAGYAISAVLRLRAEETDGHADLVLATRAGRVGWGLSQLAIAAVGLTAILTATGLGAGIGYALRSGGAGKIAELADAGLAQAPAALVLAGIATALFGLAPRVCVAGGWTALGLVALLLLVGASLRLSHWVLDISPFTHAPKLPGGSVSAVPLAWLCVTAVALAVAGLAGLRRRDIG
jgi:ABC-2 type transport system permease protein